ncbi:hypothetical protein ACFDTO_05205 [Microbacteriaceae bacterium 4G12]
MSDPREGAATRALLSDTAADAPTGVLDVDAVLRRARRRRLPRRLATGGVSALAIAGIGFAGANALGGVGQVTTLSSGPSEDSSVGPVEGQTEGGGAESGLPAPGGAVSDSGAAGGGISLAPAEKVNFCGGPLAEVAPAQTGLVATPRFPATAPVGTEYITGTVTVTNTGTERVTGYTGASPAMTVSEAGITVWHTNGPQIMMAQLIDLEPGASVDLPASFLPVRCGVEDDSAESFRENLPPLEPGVYQLSAIFYLTPEGPSAASLPSPDVVSGPLADIELQ